MQFEYSLDMGHNDFRTQILTVEELISRFNETDATNSVSVFNRPSAAQSSRIIESVLLGMPQPIVYIDDSNSERVVIEGANHLYAYWSFCRNELKLSSLYFKKQQYEGRFFYDLSPLAQSNILNTKITVNVLNPGLTPHERFGVYLCLKSRIDSASLRWCRSKIYPTEYQWIRDLAKELLPPPNRTETLESIICYMLVGHYYDLFLEGNSLNQIDAVANRLMEHVYYENLVEEISKEIRMVLEDYIKDFPWRARPAKASGLFFSVVSALYRGSHPVRKIKYEDIYDSSFGSVVYGRDDSAEAFCRAVSEMLKKIK